MKTNKLLILSLIAAFSGSAFAQSVKPLDLTDDETAKPAAEAKPAGTQSDLREQGTDEIDLEEIDDSAEAAKKALVKQNAKDLKFVDISCDEATIADILRQFRKTTNANIISDDSTNLQQRVSVNLTHVNWLQGLESILNMKGFRLEERKGIYRVVEDRQKIPVFTRTYQLNHASCEELAKLFNKSYGVIDTKTGKLVKEVATAFPAANAVVISADEKQLSECEAIIKAVDKAVTQIYIEARFMELSSSAMHQLGLQWDALKSVGVGTKDLEITAEKSEVNGDETHNATFSGTLSASDFGIYLSAFEKLSGIQIFSNPKVIVSNGKEAKVDMTTKYPNITITSRRGDSDGKTYVDYSAQLEQIKGDKKDEAKGDAGGLFAGSCFFEWGITLSVTPRISPDGLISVKIVPAISECDTDVTDDGFYKVKGGSSEDEEKESAYGRYPIIKMKSISTEFSMHDGSTAVIGGLSRTTEEDVDSGIPYLRKIPYIGRHIFGWKSRQKVQKEIIICVTLGIANPSKLEEDVGLPTNAVYAREHLDGKRQEPGFREAPADKALGLDMRTYEEIQEAPRTFIENDDARGTVSITPSAEQ